MPTSYSVVERVNERALVSSNRELLFSSSAQARVDNGSQITFRCPRSCRACGDSPLESHMVEQMEQMLALDTVECEAEVGELFGRQNTSPRACSQCCEERPVELRRTCNRNQVEAGDEVSGSFTPQVAELRLGPDLLARVRWSWAPTQRTSRWRLACSRSMPARPSDARAKRP